jgi:putative methyltransferase (TIGR04325 family)
MGTSYYQNLFFLNSLKEANWCIVEQKHFVDEGIKAYADDKLHFYYTIDECIKNYPVNTVLLSGVIQYLERPYELLEEIISKNFKYILIDRTLFIDDSEDRLTIQKVPKKIYEASYCCWFLSESKFLNRILNKYELIYDFEINENINIRSLYKGYFFRLKTNS